MKQDSPQAIIPIIGINTSSGMIFLKKREIIYCKASGSYTHIFLHGRNNNKLTVSKPLNKVLNLLQTEVFVRIHNSYAINILYLVNFNYTYKNCVTMSNGAIIAVSRAKKEAFMKKFKLL